MAAYEFLMSNIAAFTYVAIAVLPFLALLGVPLPQDLILLVSGYLASKGVVSLPAVIFLTFIVAVLVDNLEFYVAYKKGQDIIYHYGKKIINQYRYNKMREFFIREDFKAIFFSRFIPGFKGLGILIAGSVKIRWRRFFPINFLACMIYVPIVVLIGYFFGAHIKEIMLFIVEFSWILIAIIVIVAGVIVYHKRHKLKVMMKDVKKDLLPKRKN